MSAKDQKTISALQSVAKALGLIADKMTEVERKGHDAGEHSATAFQHMAEHVAKAATGFLTLETLIEGVTKALEDMEQQREKTTKEVLDYAVELKKTNLALGNILKANELDELVKKTAKEANAPVNQTNAALDAAFRAARPRNKQEAEEVAKGTVPVLALHKNDDPGTVGVIAGEAARLRRIGGPGATAEGAVGMLEMIGAEAGFSGPEALAKRGIPAMKQGVSSGMTVGESGALLATLGQALEDPTGKKAAGAMSELVGQLHKHFPGQDPGDLISRMENGDKQLLGQFKHDQFVKGKKIPAPSSATKTSSRSRRC